MTSVIKEIVSMLDMLPEDEQKFACEVMKKLILAWDADFTKVTPKEARELEIAHQQIENGEYFNEDEIEWNDLDEMNLN